jgi:ribosomal protein L29
MKTVDLVQLTNEELKKQLKETQHKLFEAKFQVRQDKLKQTHMLSGLRKEIARIKTILAAKKQSKAK